MKGKLFGERLRAARGKRSQAEAAEVLGVPKKTFIQWERSRRTPPAKAPLTQAEILARLQ